MNKIKRSWILFLISTLLATSYGFAANIDQDRNQLNRVNEQMKDKKRLLEENKKKQSSITDQMHSLDKQIDQTQKELNEINEQVNDTQKKITKTTEELTQAEENIEHKNDVLGKRLRVMYENGSVGYAEVLLNSKGITDFLSNLDMVKKIFQQDTDLLSSMKKERDDIQQKKRLLEDHKTKMNIMMKSANQKKDQLKVSRGKLTSVQNQLKANSKELERQVDELNNFARKIEDEIRRKQSSTMKYTGGKLAWPAPGYTRITSPFGYRVHPILKRKKLHTGVDIGIPRGGRVIAAADGVVIQAGWYGAYGKAVIIDHGSGLSTLYGHNSSILVKSGQKVKRGQTISKSGSTGYSTGPHLHFEVRKNGKCLDPIPWVK